MLKLRSDDNEEALKTNWWHRLFRVALWIGLITYYWGIAVFLFDEEMNKIGGYTTYSRNISKTYHHQGITILEFIAETLALIILGYILFMLIQFFYYRVLLYIAYGKLIPTINR